MNRIPPVLRLSLDVALDFFTTAANTKRFAPLTKDGDFVYVQSEGAESPEPLVYGSWDAAVAAAMQYDVPYISVAGNGRVVERIPTPHGSNDFGRVIPVPPPEYDQYAGQIIDTRKPADSAQQAEKRTADVKRSRERRQRQRKAAETVGV